MSVLDEVEELKSAKEKEQAQKNNVSDESKGLQATEKREASLQEVSTQEGINRMVARTVEEGRDIKAMARDLTYLAGADNLQRNDDFKQVYAQALGEQMLRDLEDEGKREAIKSAARKQEAKNLRAETYYNGCKPIFDLLGIEAAFGLVPMIITTVLLMVPFLLVSLVRFTINSINSIFTAIAGFKKPAFWLCSIVVCIVITALIVLAGIWCVDQIFGTHIILR